MVKTIVLVFVSGALAGLLLVASPKESNSGSSEPIQVKNMDRVQVGTGGGAYIIDVGDVDIAKPAARTLVLQNRTSYDVELRHISCTCACLTAKVGVDRIPPGESAPIELVLDLSGHWRASRAAALVRCVVRDGSGRARRELVLIRVDGERAMRPGDPALPDDGRLQAMEVGSLDLQDRE